MVSLDSPHPLKPKLISIQEAVDLLRVSESTIKNLFDRGALTRIKIGRRTLIEVSEIDAMIARLKEIARDN